MACRRLGALAVALLAGSILVSCGGAANDADRTDRSVTIYSGRNEKLVGPLLDQFEFIKKIEPRVRYASTSELTATIMTEGHRTPAAVFISQDAAALGALSNAGLLRELPADILEKVPARFRSHRNDWIGLSGRARVVVYNTERISAAELPRSLAQTTEERFRGRFGVAPNNASFQAHMAAYMVLNGEDALRDLLRGMTANKPRIYPSNNPIVEAVIAGEIDWGLVNHYYLLRALSQNPGAPARNYIMTGADGSDFVNVAGVAILQETPEALELVRFLASDLSQRYFAQKTFEYALVEGPDPAQGLPARARNGSRVDYGSITGALDATLAQIQESGLTRFQ